MPPGYGELASRGPALASLPVSGAAAAHRPVGGHSLQFGPGTTPSWSGSGSGPGTSLTLYHHASYAEDPADADPGIVLAPGFTPLLLDPVSQSGRSARAQERADRRNAVGGSRSPADKGRLTFDLKQALGPLDAAVTGDYGIYRIPVSPDLDLFREEKLLRLGANLGVGEFQVRSSMGAEIKPFSIGNTLAWDLAATYSEGPWAFGVAYTHSLLADAPSTEEVDTLGTLQSGMRYAIAPDMSAGAHATFWNLSDDESSAANDVAGVLSFSMRF